MNPTLGEQIEQMLRAYLTENNLKGLGGINGNVLRGLIDEKVARFWSYRN